MIKLSSDDHNEPAVEISADLFDRMRKVMATEILVGLDEEMQEKIRQLVMAAIWRVGAAFRARRSPKSARAHAERKPRLIGGVFAHQFGIGNSGASL
jgi:hypothetical protein